MHIALLLAGAVASTAAGRSTPEGPHLTLGLGLFGAGTSEFTLSGSAQQPQADAGLFLDVGVEAGPLRLALEAGTALIQIHVGFHADYLFASDGWTCALGAAASTAASGNELGNFSLTAFTPEGGLAWRVHGHTRLLALARVGVAAIDEGASSYFGPATTSLRPWYGGVVQWVVF